MCHHRCAMASQNARPFQHLDKHMFLTNISPRAKHAETDPRHGTPTMAHFQPPDSSLQTRVGHVETCSWDDSHTQRHPSTRRTFFPQSFKNHYFRIGPISVDPIRLRPTKALTGRLPLTTTTTTTTATAINTATNDNNRATFD